MSHWLQQWDCCCIEPHKALYLLYISTLWPGPGSRCLGYNPHSLTGPGQHSLLYARPWAQWSLMATPTNSPSPEQQTRTSLWNSHEVIPQVPSSIIFVKKLAQRCGVWQIKHITSPDQDQVSMKLNMFGFGVIHKRSLTKPIKQPKMDWFGLVWFDKGMYFMLIFYLFW